ncbi:MAG: hypothetical protein ABIJ82_00565, partial [Patescibacteria group bacterium]
MVKFSKFRFLVIIPLSFLLFFLFFTLKNRLSVVYAASCTATDCPSGWYVCQYGTMCCKGK